MLPLEIYLVSTWLHGSWAGRRAQCMDSRKASCIAGTLTSKRTPAPAGRKGLRASSSSLLEAGPACLLSEQCTLSPSPNQRQIKGLGWLHAVAFIAATRRSARSSLCSSAVFNSSTGRRGLLAAFRACMLLWSLFIGLNQLADKGVIVLTYFTVWNWWFMTLFFALATLASLRALHRVRCGGQDAASRPADVLEHAAVVAFAVEAPVRFDCCRHSLGCCWVFWLPLVDWPPFGGNIWSGVSPVSLGWHSRGADPL